MSLDPDLVDWFIQRGQLEILGWTVGVLSLAFIVGMACVDVGVSAVWLLYRKAPILLVRRTFLGALILLVCAAFGFYLNDFNKSVKTAWQSWESDWKNRIQTVGFAHYLGAGEEGSASFELAGATSPRRLYLRARGPSYKAPVDQPGYYVAEPVLALESTSRVLAENASWRNVRPAVFEEFEVSQWMSHEHAEPGLGVMLPDGEYTLRTRDARHVGGAVLTFASNVSEDGGGGQIVGARFRARTYGSDHKLELMFVIKGDHCTSVEITTRGPSLDVPLADRISAVDVEVVAARSKQTGRGPVTVAKSDAAPDWIPGLIPNLLLPQEPVLRLSLKPGHYMVTLRARGKTDGIAQVELRQTL